MPAAVSPPVANSAVRPPVKSGVWSPSQLAGVVTSVSDAPAPPSHVASSSEPWKGMYMRPVPLRTERVC